MSGYMLVRWYIWVAQVELINRGLVWLVSNAPTHEAREALRREGVKVASRRERQILPPLREARARLRDVVDQARGDGPRRRA